MAFRGVVESSSVDCKVEDGGCRFFRKAYVIHNGIRTWRHISEDSNLGVCSFSSH
jgi:hypothetical protein